MGAGCKNVCSETDAPMSCRVAASKAICTFKSLMIAAMKMCAFCSSEFESSLSVQPPSKLPPKVVRVAHLRVKLYRETEATSW